MDKNQVFAKYTDRTHLYGRIGMAIGILLMLAAPVFMGLVLGEAPDMGAFWGAFLASGLTWSLISIAEFLIYTPMLGAGGGYLAFLTGNLINMKIPCMMNARSITGAETGTPENEIASTLSIAASAMTTTAVVAIGVLLMQVSGLGTVLENPMLKPAFANVVAALFGALGFQYFRKDLRVSIPPLVIMTLLFTFVPALLGAVSFMMVPSGAIALGIALLLAKRDRRGEELQDQQH